MMGVDVPTQDRHPATTEVDRTGGVADTSAYATAVRAQARTDAVLGSGGSTTAWEEPSSGGDDVCPDCGHHTMAFGACLPALTLLVLAWLLAPPQVRHLPPLWLWQPRIMAVLAGRPLPALSLAQLSVRRT